MNNNHDPFANSNTRPTAEERRIAELIAGRSRRKPISSEELQHSTGLTKREVMATIEALRRIHQFRIGASRDFPMGYYQILTPDDEAAAVGAYLKQIESMLRTVKRMSSPEGWRRLMYRVDRTLKDLNGEERHHQAMDHDSHW